jgi:metallo-beta-lactamase class B
VIAVLLAGGGVAQQRVDWNAQAPWRVWDTPPPNAKGDPESREANKREPIKLFDNVYFVGLHNVAAYVVTTSAGLVLLDASYPDSADYILDNIRKLKLDPTAIRYIFVSHAHGDHSGGAARIQAVSKARVGLSAEDWAVQERGAQNTLKRDLVIKDGETITVGDTAFTFYVSPGHTPGSLTTTFYALDGSRKYRVISPGGLGLAFSAEWTPKYIDSLERFKKVGPFDVLLPNHPYMTTGGLFAQAAGIAGRKPGAPHPVLLGPERINAFFDTALAVARRKLAEEQKTAAGK